MTTRFARNTWRLKLRLQVYDARCITADTMLANAERLGLTHEATRRRKMLDRAIAMRAKIAAEILRRGE